MNKKYILKIPIKDVVEGDVKTVADVNVTLNTMLSPMYTTEAELLAFFVDEEEYEKYYLKAREIAFTSSLRADEYLKARMKLTKLLPEHALLFKRELSQCLAINGLANYFFKGYNESVSRAKTLGEFSVSTTVKNNTSALRDIISNSNDCIKDAKKAIDEISALSGSGLGVSFSKGSLNIGSRFSYRAWFHNNLPERSEKLFASDKYRHPNGNMYKDGNRGDVKPNVSDTGAYNTQRTS